MNYWTITVIENYFNQLSQFSIEIQTNIHQQWSKIADQEDISNIKKTRCPQGHEYFKIVFQGLAFEFIFQLEEKDKKIRLINCKELEFSKHAQVD
ncbi:MAG: hypothetical protein ABJB76_01085 [Candidatus Nitrosocosmicus sp.]